MRGLLTLVGVVWMLGCGGLGLAQTRIQRIHLGEKERGITAFAASDDGTVVVGEGWCSGRRIFRWTHLTGIQWISNTSYGDNSQGFYPQSMTADGAAIYGTIFLEGPYLWNLKDGFRKIGDLDVPIGLASSADGSVVFAIEGYL